MRKVWIANSAGEMQKARGLWESLHVEGRHTIFQSYSWNEAAARIFAQSEAPLVAIAESDSGMAIIPACVDVAAKRMSLLGETLFDYRDVLHVGDPSVLSKAWISVASAAVKHGLTFEATALRQSVAALKRWANFDLQPFSAAPFLLRTASATAHHPRLSRNLRRLACLGVDMRRYDGRNVALLKTIYTLKAAEAGSLFRNPMRIGLIIALAQNAPGACELFTLEHDGNVVAALVTFLDGLYRRFYTTYFHEAWAKHSPGLTLIHEVVQQTVAAGLNCDFLTGDQPYKLRLAASSVPLLSMSASAKALQDISRGAFTAHAA